MSDKKIPNLRFSGAATGSFGPFGPKVTKGVRNELPGPLDLGAQKSKSESKTSQMDYFWNGVWGRVCNEAEISEEKRLFTKSGEGIQWMEALVRNSTGKGNSVKELRPFSVNRRTLQIETNLRSNAFPLFWLFVDSVLEFLCPWSREAPGTHSGQCPKRRKR